MSEREDIANAFESFGRRLTGITDCLLELLSEVTDLRHEQNGHFQRVSGLAEEADKVLQDVRSKVFPTLEHVADEVLQLRKVRQDDVRSLSSRMRAVEAKVGIEVTKV